MDVETSQEALMLSPECQSTLRDLRSHKHLKYLKKMVPVLRCFSAKGGFLMKLFVGRVDIRGQYRRVQTIGRVACPIVVTLWRAGWHLEYHTSRPSEFIVDSGAVVNKNNHRAPRRHLLLYRFDPKFA
ncbi:hypothetical protein BDZ89DRAFT_1046063 [Hymenopellis radicata]|nr:hypothetical protein BDZ89DRAFT_1046063 [Hymenopellis radicata]